MKAHVDDVTTNCWSSEKMGQRTPVAKTKLAALTGSSFESTEKLVLYIRRYNSVPTIDSAVHIESLLLLVLFLSQFILCCNIIIISIAYECCHTIMTGYIHSYWCYSLVPAHHNVHILIYFTQ
jgi:hypothetical protein